MMGGALGCFRAGTTDLLLKGDVLLAEKICPFFGIPNTTMSSYACFQRLPG
jgi:hypothetical protein